MRFTSLLPILAAAMLPTASIARYEAPSVRSAQGNLLYIAADGQPRRLLADGKVTDPILSPDGKTAAFIHYDGPKGQEKAATSLWLITIADGRARRLFAATPNDKPELNMATFRNPRFSPDGDAVYVDAEAWTVSQAVHRIDVATGRNSFVVDGSVLSVTQSGPQRGYLLVQRHVYLDGGGSYNPSFLVSPDGKMRHEIPGSDEDERRAAIASQAVTEQPARQTAPSAIQRLPSGSLDGLVTEDDYPPAALAQHAQGTSRLELTVGTNGHVSGCRVVKSSGHEELDEAACKIIMRRARLSPALDADGLPIAATMAHTVFWKLPEN